MGDLLKGIHLLPQGDFETAVENNQIDDDVIYVTPEDFSSLSREQTKQIAENTEDIAANKINIENNAAQIELLKNSISGSSEDLVEIKNTIQEIISRDISQDSRLDDIENNYATEEFVIENGGKIDKIAVNGVDQTITNKRVNLTVPTKVSELTNDSGYAVASDVDGKIAENLTTAKSYTDSEIAALIDSAPETRDTLAELAKAIQDNETVVDALNSAIGNKADKTELVKYLPLTGGIVSGEVTAESGVLFGNYKVVSSGKAGSDFQIVHTIDNSEILSYVNETQMTVGDSNVRLELHGYGDRPYYNNASSVTKQLALIDDIPSSLNQLTEDSTHRLVTDAEKSRWNAKLDSFTETDPTVPAWAKNATKPEYDYSEIKNTPDIPEGVVLYSTTGQNTDGAMTQKATTDALELKATTSDIIDAVTFAEEERQKSENNLFGLFYNGTLKAGTTGFKLTENISVRVTCNDSNGGIVIKSTNTSDGIIYEFSDVTGSTHYATLYFDMINLKPSTQYRINFTQTQSKEDGRFMESGTYGTPTYKYFTTDENGNYSHMYFRVNPRDIGGTDPLIVSNVQIIENANYTEYQKYYGPVIHDADLIKRQPKLLWTNPNPGASFGAQTVTLASNDYDYLLIESCFDTDNTTTRNTQYFKKDNGGRIMWTNGATARVGSRNFTTSADFSQINFETTYWNGGASNQDAIPTRIYGGKR